MYLQQIMSPCTKSKTETAHGSEKHVQSKQQRHQSDPVDIVVVSSSPTQDISYTPHQLPHLRPREDKHTLGHKN